jgi:protein TonB
MRFLLLSACYLLSYVSVFQLQDNSSQQNKTTPQSPYVLRVTMTSDVMKKSLIHKVIPNYPYEARQQHISGTVKLHVVIGVDGSVKRVDYVSGPEIFVKPTIDAVRQYKYKPMLVNGQFVEVDTTVETVLSLTH